MTTGSRAALEALASPVRQELLAALGNGPATVTELAAQLGRSRQALYYHLGALVDARLAAADAWRGSGRSRERVYRFALADQAVAAHAGSRAELGLAARSADAMLRLTAREFRDRLADPQLRREGPRRSLLAMRGKARLTATELGRLNQLIDGIHRLLAAAKPRRGGRLYSVTVVLTPSREAGAS